MRGQITKYAAPPRGEADQGLGLTLAFVHHGAERHASGARGKRLASGFDHLGLQGRFPRKGKLAG